MPLSEALQAVWVNTEGNGEVRYFWGNRRGWAAWSKSLRKLWKQQLGGAFQNNSVFTKRKKNLNTWDTPGSGILGIKVLWVSSVVCLRPRACTVSYRETSETAGSPPNTTLLNFCHCLECLGGGGASVNLGWWGREWRSIDMSAPLLLEKWFLTVATLENQHWKNEHLNRISAPPAGNDEPKIGDET